MRQTEIVLTNHQEAELIKLRDHAREPYMRERCAAILKVASGKPVSTVAQLGLLRKRKPHTVSDWINRYRQYGVDGLRVRSGRGRKPAFFPGVSQCGCSPTGPAGAAAFCAGCTRYPPHPLGPC